MNKKRKIKQQLVNLCLGVLFLAGWYLFYLLLTWMAGLLPETWQTWLFKTPFLDIHFDKWGFSVVTFRHIKMSALCIFSIVIWFGGWILWPFLYSWKEKKDKK